MKLSPKEVIERERVCFKGVGEYVLVSFVLCQDHTTLAVSDMFVKEEGHCFSVIFTLIFIPEANHQSQSIPLPLSLTHQL